MPFKFQRICPICGKEELTNISRHLSLVHGLSSFARKPWLKLAKYQTMNTVYKHLSSKTREQTKYSYPVNPTYYRPFGATSDIGGGTMYPPY